LIEAKTKTLLLALAASAVLCAEARAEKIPPDFRAAFERVFVKGRGFAVCVQKGVPTTSINGVNNDSNGSAHYSIDVLDAQRWKTSQGVLDFDQVAVDHLDFGEVMEIADVSWKDNRVDMRMVSVESKKVTRGTWILKTERREPVATNFKFFFPAEWKNRYLGAADAPDALTFITSWLMPFPNEAEARNFSVQLRAGGANAPVAPAAAPTAARAAAPANAAAAPAPAAKTVKREIKAGMTALEVIDIMGKPQSETSFQSQSKWVYPDLTVIFDNGRVKEVRF